MKIEKKDMNLVKKDINSVFLDYVPISVIGVLIVVFAVVEKQSVIKTMPTLITLVVQLLLMRANRYAFLLGGANSLLYAVSYFKEELFFSAVAATIISFPVQIYSYFNWKKKTVSSTPQIKELSWARRAVLAPAVAFSWVLMTYLLGERLFEGEYVAVDILLFVLGLVTAFLSAFMYLDAQIYSVVATGISVGLWTCKLIDDPRCANFLIISVYNLYMVTRTLISWYEIRRRLTHTEDIHKKTKREVRYEKTSN